MRPTCPKCPDAPHGLLPTGRTRETTPEARSSSAATGLVALILQLALLSLLAGAVPALADTGQAGNPSVADNRTVAAAASASPGERAVEDTQVRMQSTYIFQRKPGFTSPYSAGNSLRAAAERSYTSTTTGYFGLRPWQGGEVYANIEATQGVPASGLVGLGGFGNGEATRAASSNPKIYRQRLFMRQTIGLGNGSETLESDANQMASIVDRDRVVITAGNFSLLDVLDDNAYAKDPRLQFFNWSNMTYAAYDYAADARGFGWGASTEWYTGDWIVRWARMTAPRDPNGLAIDYDITRHYGDQIEIDRGHTLGELPGRVRLLAYRNRARLATFRDARAWGNAHPGQQPALLGARTGDHIKTGIGINLEQAVSASTGVFLRAMSSDGRTETMAFTEADRSIAAGLSVRGTAWRRAEDTVGLALMQNRLSADRRDYLAAGNLSFFIGDGGLRYRPESIFETYYSLALNRHLALTLDYQHIANPAYNAERGPARFFGFRAHLEF